VIPTNLSRHLPRVADAVFRVVQPLFLKTPAQGAATQVFVATHPSVASVTGEYFADSNLARPRADADDPVLARRLWEVTEEIAARLPR